MTEKRIPHPNTKHGHTSPRRTKSPEYESWCQMKQRCLRKSYIQHQDYAGRGITIYEPWISCFISFLKYMGPKPEPKNLYSLDRIDNNGNYEPGNVRWATRTQQSNNRRPRGPEKRDKFISSICKSCHKEFMRNPKRKRLYCDKRCAKNFRERRRYHRNKGVD